MAVATARILLVDDFGSDCAQRARYLHHAGYEVLWAYSAETALKMLENFECQAMIFNQDVAVQNPHELAELLAQKYPRIPMIVFTRREDAEDEIAYPFAAAVASSSGKAIVTALHQVISEQADLESAAETPG
jgi:DNA-binding response OmpR family regulator